MSGRQRPAALRCAPLGPALFRQGTVRHGSCCSPLDRHSSAGSLVWRSESPSFALRGRSACSSSRADALTWVADRRVAGVSPSPHEGAGLWATSGSLRLSARAAAQTRSRGERGRGARMASRARAREPAGVSESPQQRVGMHTPLGRGAQAGTAAPWSRPAGFDPGPPPATCSRTSGPIRPSRRETEIS